VPDLQTDWVVLAQLIRPQGRNGELLVNMLTDFPERFEPGRTVYLAKEHFSGDSSEARQLTIASGWLPHGRNQGRIVLGFDGVDSIESAQSLAGLEVIVPGTDRVPLTDGSVYVDALVGCTIYDHDIPIGTVRDVQFMTTPDGKRRLEEAAPLLVVDLPSGELLIPFAKNLLSSVDTERKMLHMELPEGLLDLNTASISADQKRNAKPSETTG